MQQPTLTLTSVFRPLLLSCHHGHEAAPLLASAAGVVVLSKGIYVTLCRAASVTVPCSLLCTNICPHPSVFPLERRIRPALPMHTSALLLCHVLPPQASSSVIFSLPSTSWLLVMLHAPQCHLSSLQHPVSLRQVPAGEVGVVVAAQPLIDKLSNKQSLTCLNACLL